MVYLDLRLVLMPAMACLLGGATSPSELQVQIDNLRNGKGLVHICLTMSRAHFPDCSKDPKAVKRSLPTAQAATVSISGLAAGEYALSIFHDENSNTKFDTFLGIPREGFGFSRNPAIRFGPPRYDQVRFEIGEGIARQKVKMQYLL